MIYRTVSSKRIISKVYRDFKPSNSNWIVDAIEWIGEAIDVIKCYPALVQKTEEVKVTGYRARIPCDLEVMLGVEYNNMRLPRSGGINIQDYQCSCLDNLTCSPDESYILNPNYIQTTFEEGCVKFHYKGIETDAEGFPTVPDNTIVQEAISWYIMRQMCLRGFRHQTVDFGMANAMWEKYYPKAQNQGKDLDIDGYANLMKTTLGVIKSTNMVNEMFNTLADANEGITVNTPGTLVTNSSTVIRE